MQQNIKTVIVTGSNKGIGYGIVDGLGQRQGWKVIMACRDLERAKKSQQ
jgi:NAD(P)-dependent dehydrogenase (short-subunit alcohol dehydrogenase family)